MVVELPPQLRASYEERKEQIRQRLNEFAAVPQEEWFYETAFCLLTPQSKAVHADAVIRTLKERGFRDGPFDPVDTLRDPNHYIRFHRVKADRLLWLQQHWLEIEPILADARHHAGQDHAGHLRCRERRDALAGSINGMGLKEASHVLRNIGCRGLAIIDRHLLRCLEACGVIPDRSVSMTARRYHEIEIAFAAFSSKVGIEMDELDLLFWSEISGLLLK